MQNQCLWEHCGAVLNSQEDFIQHVNSQHVERDPPYECKWVGCDKFNQSLAKSIFLIHMTKHSGEKKFQCDIDGCNKSFARQDALRKHQKKIHDWIQSPSTANRKRSIGQLADHRVCSEGHELSDLPIASFYTEQQKEQFLLQDYTQYLQQSKHDLNDELVALEAEIGRRKYLNKIFANYICQHSTE
ncbi:hypothetical protein MIR68_006796 [Amoeboaphelidium protococcarum]|nr:hypothetical protein MIR68_006796 [Amoeboaphelidium protococcarum]